MIEKYFRVGVRVKWTKPQDAIHPAGNPRVYTMVDSQEPARPMIYDGLDDQLRDLALTSLVNVTTLGLEMRMPIQHAWLDYAPSRTARLPIGPYDVLTGYMSGCIIAHWSDKGLSYLGHVGTIDNQPAINREVKRAFAFAMRKDTRGFSPSDVWQAQEIQALSNRIRPQPEIKILGLVTTRGDFYSILMLKLQGHADQWCVGGCKSGRPIDHDTLKLQMLRND